MSNETQTLAGRVNAMQVVIDVLTDENALLKRRLEQSQAESAMWRDQWRELTDRHRASIELTRERMKRVGFFVALALALAIWSLSIALWRAFR